jgi:hypothetical protein
MLPGSALFRRPRPARLALAGLILALGFVGNGCDSPPASGPAAVSEESKPKSPSHQQWKGKDRPGARIRK